MRSNQLSYLAIALKASAKVDIIFIFANFFATFFNFSFNLCSEALFAYWADGVGLWVLVGSSGFSWKLFGKITFSVCRYCLLVLLSSCSSVCPFVRCVGFCYSTKKQAHLERHACLFYRISDILLLVLNLQV